jgi:maltose O-acetyltransferase
MSLLETLLTPVVALKHGFEKARLKRRWCRLQNLGMHIGKGVNLPASTLIDESHCFLISIGDYCGFGEQCYILAHDAQMNEYLDATRLGRVIIHESCHIGTRTVILEGVEIGPRTIVGANSVVSHTLPPNTVCAGVPAKVICTLDEYLDRHRKALKDAPTFNYSIHSIHVITDEEKALMIRALTDRDGYMISGYSALMRGEGWPVITPHGRSFFNSNS